MNELTEGTKLKSLTGPGDEHFAYMELGPGPERCSEIVVVMQPGQMGMVPWVRATMNNGRVYLHNLSNVESVELLGAS